MEWLFNAFFSHTYGNKNLDSEINLSSYKIFTGFTNSFEVGN